MTILDQVYWGFTMVPLLWLRKQLVRGTTQDEARSFRPAFVPPHPWIHALLKGVMAVETGLVKRPPIGSSVMSAVRKNR